MCPFGRGDVKSRCNDERPCKFSQGKTPPRICLSDYPDVLLLAFFADSEFQLCGWFFLLEGTQSEHETFNVGKHWGFFVATLQKKKKKKPPVLCFVLGCFLGVVLVKCSVHFLLSPATTIFWKDEPCLQMFIKQVSFLYNSMLDFSMLTFKRKY